jgi:FAD/FMN-containing dehydrogenase
LLTSSQVNVTSADDVSAGIQFATKYNIRLVVRNTGHEYVRQAEESK